MRKRTGRKIVVLILEILILIMLVLCIIAVKRYQNIFCKNTVINGLDCSFLTVDQAEKIIQQEEGEYVLKVNFKDNETELISGSDIEFTIKDLRQELENIKERQRKNLFMLGGEYKLENYSYNEEKLKEILSDKEQLNAEYMKDKTKIKYYFDSNTNRFEIDKKNVYFLDFGKVLTVVSDAISNKEKSVSLDNLYLMPEADSVLNKLNSYIMAKITYQFPDGKKYELNASTLSTWLLKDKDGNYTKNESVWNKNIENFVTDKLNIMANTTEKAIKFKPTGKKSEISVEGGNYGYQIDKEQEIKMLKDELNNQVCITRIPCYKTIVTSAENEGLGKSYVEIDLTRQKVWVYVDGKLEVETDCVTGCVSKKHDTPTGVYTLTYKQKDRILKGEKLPNGKYSYQSHVNFWMPFNGGIGLHDASWRKKFGGDIYLKNGSHGCVNLPYAAAKKIYGIIDGNMPIVVYKS